MSGITKPIILDETGQSIVAALLALAEQNSNAMAAAVNSASDAAAASASAGQAATSAAQAVSKAADAAAALESITNAVENIQDGTEMAALQANKAEVVNIANVTTSSTLLATAAKCVFHLNGEPVHTAPAFYDGTEYLVVCAHHDAGSAESRYYWVLSGTSCTAVYEPGDAVPEWITDRFFDSQVVKAAENLKSWDDVNLPAEDEQTVNIFTTGGDTSINSNVNANLQSIAAKSDFYAAKLLSTGFNLLRLSSNNGPATAVGTGYYFPVPTLTYGTIGTAQQVNGVLLTANDGTNINNATVYFKPLSSGVPTSVTDGSVMSYTDGVINGKTYRFYTCNQPGYMIVSGITWANTCAHLGWSKRYDEFIAPNATGDAGSEINISAAIHQLHSYDKLLVVGQSSDRIERISATQVKLYANCDRVSTSWTNTLNDDGTTYTHSQVISGMKYDGAAEIMGSSQVLTIIGNEVSYTDSESTGISGYIKYEKASPSSSTYNLATSFAVEDWGEIIFMSATGECYSTISYAQEIPDNLRALVNGVLDKKLQVATHAICELYNELAGLKAALKGYQSNIQAHNVDAEDYSKIGIPTILVASTTGAPSASVIPDNWNTDTMGAWTACPRYIGQTYIDKPGKKVYISVDLTNSTSDWAVLN